MINITLIFAIPKITLTARLLLTLSSVAYSSLIIWILASFHTLYSLYTCASFEHNCDYSYAYILSDYNVLSSCSMPKR